MSATTDELTALAARIQSMDFEHVFTLHADGSITEPRDVWAPSVFHDPTGGVTVDGAGWDCMTGLTGQYSYHGAVMHPSEYIGRGIAGVMLDDCQDGPVTYALVCVYVWEEDREDEDEDDVCGWAIAYRRD